MSYFNNVQLIGFGAVTDQNYDPTSVFAQSGVAMSRPINKLGKDVDNLLGVADNMLFKKQVNSEASYTKEAPGNLLWVTLDKIGGKTTTGSGGALSHAKVNKVTSSVRTFSFNSRIYLPTTDVGNSFSITHDGIEYGSIDFEALLYGSTLYFARPSEEEPLTVDLENVETRFDEESQMDVFVSGDLPSNFDNNFVVKSLDDSSVLGGWFGDNGTFVATSQDVFTVPDAVLDLDDYGVSLSSTVYNYVDLKEKKYHRVCKVENGHVVALATEQVTDITKLLPGDNFIATEPGYTLTFCQVGGGTENVPSSVSFYLDGAHLYQHFVCVIPSRSCGQLYLTMCTTSPTFTKESFKSLCEYSPVTGWIKLTSSATVTYTPYRVRFGRQGLTVSNLVVSYKTDNHFASAIYPFSDVSISSATAIQVF